MQTDQIYILHSIVQTFSRNWMLPSNNSKRIKYSPDSGSTTTPSGINEPDEITNRLDWLELPVTMEHKLDELSDFANDLTHLDLRPSYSLAWAVQVLPPKFIRRFSAPSPASSI